MNFGVTTFGIQDLLCKISIRVYQSIAKVIMRLGVSSNILHI